MSSNGTFAIGERVELRRTAIVLGHNADGTLSLLIDVERDEVEASVVLADGSGAIVPSGRNVTAVVAAATALRHRDAKPYTFTPGEMVSVKLPFGGRLGRFVDYVREGARDNFAAHVTIDRRSYVVKVADLAPLLQLEGDAPIVDAFHEAAQAKPETTR